MEAIAIIFIISVFIMMFPFIVLTGNWKLLHEQLYMALTVNFAEAS